MIDALWFLAPPLAACLALVALLGYFGLHVLLRHIIFVDLALAQIAALGTVVAFFFGHEIGSPASFAYSLAATILGAALFSMTRTRNGVVPHEAIIGILYVVASAATILVADRAPEGAEHVKELLAGTILWVTWPVVLRNLLLFAAVGLLHWLLRRRFVEISEDPEACYAKGVRVGLWDFLFYASFGLVITLAVEIAGVLMVFAYLVAPAIVALLSSESWPIRLGIAWLTGAGASAGGLAASYAFDLPSGPAVVCLLGLMLALFAGWRTLRGRRVAGDARRDYASGGNAE